MNPLSKGNKIYILERKALESHYCVRVVFELKTINERNKLDLSAKVKFRFAV